ncbi:C40 family peptidase [Pasteurella multocida]|nr:C40 family peptidase [Pasteurella multocida]HDR0955232.1 C40 family peptidase [Pasteurella multocida]
MVINEELKQQILKHAKQCEPQESCGFVVFEGRNIVYLPCDNIADDPESYFEISPDDWLKATQYEGIIALVHSHPDGKEKGLPYLSILDRESQVRTALDWWLVADGEIKQYRSIPPLLKREFKNQIQDCRVLCLDAYMLAGLDIDQSNLKYEFEWFENGENLYEEYLLKAGFYKLEQGEQEQLGDVVLLQVGSPVPNHAGIYLGDQTMLHHSVDRLSARVPYGNSWLDSTHSVWRHKEWQRLHFTAILNDLQATHLN